MTFYDSFQCSKITVKRGNLLKLFLHPHTTFRKLSRPLSSFYRIPVLFCCWYYKQTTHQISYIPDNRLLGTAWKNAEMSKHERTQKWASVTISDAPTQTAWFYTFNGKSKDSFYSIPVQIIDSHRHPNIIKLQERLTQTVFENTLLRCKWLHLWNVVLNYAHFRLTCPTCWTLLIPFFSIPGIHEEGRKEKTLQPHYVASKRKEGRRRRERGVSATSYSSPCIRASTRNVHE